MKILSTGIVMMIITMRMRNGKNYDVCFPTDENQWDFCVKGVEYLRKYGYNRGGFVTDRLMLR